LSGSAGCTPCSRHQALVAASFIAADAELLAVVQAAFDGLLAGFDKGRPDS